MTAARHEALHRRLARLCDELAAAPFAGDDELAATAATVRAQLGQPLSLAVVGRVKAGKSTLINALVGQRIAPTNEAECTRVVTEYRYGLAPSADIVRTDGSVTRIPFDGALPDDLGVPAASISHVVVSVPAAALRDLVLIDTPGLATSSEPLAEQTRRAVLGSGSARRADAIVYVFRATERLDDVEFLSAFDDASSGSGKQLASSIGVLSHADQFASGAWGAEDPIAAARRTADGMAERRRAELAEIVAVAGRMAELAATGEVQERDALALSRLARLDDEEVLELQFAPSAVEGLDQAEAERIATKFHGYPLRHARAAAAGGAAGLSAWLDAASGIAALRLALRARYVGRFPLLKSAQGLTMLREAADATEHRAGAIQLIDDALTEDALQPIEQLAAWEELRARHPDAAETVELDALLGARDDRELLGLPIDAAADSVTATAIAAASRTQAAANLAADSALANANRVLSRAYLRIADEWDRA